jgi:hypothetical protein
MYSILSKKRPYNNFTPQQVPKAVTSRTLPSIDDFELSDSTLETIYSDCLQFSPENRPSFEQICPKLAT